LNPDNRADNAIALSVGLNGEIGQGRGATALRKANG